MGICFGTVQKIHIYIYTPTYTIVFYWLDHGCKGPYGVIFLGEVYVYSLNRMAVHSEPSLKLT